MGMDVRIWQQNEGMWGSEQGEPRKRRMWIETWVLWPLAPLQRVAFLCLHNERPHVPHGYGRVLPASPRCVSLQCGYSLLKWYLWSGKCNRVSAISTLSPSRLLSWWRSRWCWGRRTSSSAGVSCCRSCSTSKTSSMPKPLQLSWGLWSGVPWPPRLLRFWGLVTAKWMVVLEQDRKGQSYIPLHAMASVGRGLQALFKEVERDGRRSCSYSVHQDAVLLQSFCLLMALQACRIVRLFGLPFSWSFRPSLHLAGCWGRASPVYHRTQRKGVHECLTSDPAPLQSGLCHWLQYVLYWATAGEC